MKSALTILTVFVWSLPCLAQVDILTEDFEGLIPPPGWTRTQNTPSAGWEFGSSLGSPYFSIPAHTTYAASNDDAHDDGNGTANLADRDRLITPVLDLTPYASSGVVLDFEYVHPGTYGSIASIEVSLDGGSTWNQVAIIPAATEWTTWSVGLSAYTGNSTVLVAFRHNDGGDWADGFAVDDITVRSVESLDVRVDGLTVDEYVGPGLLLITAQITNRGAATVTDLSAVYQIDSGSPIPGPIGGLNLGLGESVEIAHPVPYNFGSTGPATITFTVSAVNGSADGNPSDNTVVGDVQVLSMIPDRHPVLEVHTGSWCQFCPDGTVRMEEVLATIPDAIAVTIHSTDAMEIPDGNAVSATYIGGYPSATVDRFKFDDQADVEVNRGVWLPKVTERATTVVPVAVSIPMVAFDGATRTIDVEVQAEFFADVTGDLRINCWVVEDGVVGSGSGYDQVNFYNTQAGHPFFGAGNPIIGFVHDRVVRAMLGGSWGSSGIIPGAVSAGEVYSTSYSHVVPGDQNVQNLTVVGVIQRYDADTNQRHILNAFETAVDQPFFDDGFESGGVTAWTSSTP